MVTLSSSTGSAAAHGYLTTTAQFFELDEQKKIIRQFTDHVRFTSINKVQVLDVPGDPAKDEVWR